MDSGYRTLAGEMLEGEEGPKAAGEGFTLGGESFTEGEDCGISRGQGR